VQGYYFSRPVPAPQFAELLRVGISQPALLHSAVPVSMEMAGKSRLHRLLGLT